MSDELRVTARATVRVTLEIDCPSRWGDDCTVAQVYKQAADDARRTLNAMLPVARGNTVRLVSNPHVIMVTADRDAQGER